MEEAPGGAAPRGVARQQVLAHGVVVVVHGDPGAQRLLGEGQAGLLVALLEAALVPYVIVLWLVCKEVRDKKDTDTSASCYNKTHCNINYL